MTFIHRIAGLLVFTSLTASAQESVLGKIEFPNSGEAAAQEAFLNGVRMLHSFEWEDAAEAFQEAQRIDPDFALAYWGEALSHTGGHHFPPDQDMAAARQALQKLARSRRERLEKAPTEREKMYLEAVELLYGEGDMKERSQAYSDAMGRLSARHPEDLEAATLYALSLMRTKVRGPESLREDMQAGAISQRVFRENPDHPGAAHYIIHAYDDPVHAPIALYAAHKYAEIAPAAVHALHMPAHIFVQHGMWDYVAKSNEASYEASVDRAARKNLSPTRHSFHALYWLQYAYLQQGRYDDARETVEELRRIANREDAVKSHKERVLRMEALQTVETERWDTGDVDSILAQIRGSDSIDERTAATVLFANGMSAVRTGDVPTAKKATEGIASLREAMSEGDARQQVAIMEKEMEALVAVAEGRAEAARELMAQAVGIAESMVPPSGPPGESPTDSPIKPAHELYGEILLDQGRPVEALAQFQESLLLTPKRVRSLLGLARAAKELDRTDLAQKSYESIAHIPGAGSNLPGLEEARGYLQSSEDE